MNESFLHIAVQERAPNLSSLLKEPVFVRVNLNIRKDEQTHVRNVGKVLKLANTEFRVAIMVSKDRINSGVREISLKQVSNVVLI